MPASFSVINTVTGSAFGIDATAGLNPVFTISNDPILPGTGSVQLPTGTTGQRLLRLGAMRLNTTTGLFECSVDGASWVSLAVGGGGIASITGTANQIGVTAGANPIVSIASNPILPGTGGATLPTGSTGQRAGAAGTIRYNSTTGLVEFTNNGVGWLSIPGATLPTTDKAVARFDGVAGQLQNSLAILSDAGALSGLTQLDVDNLRLDLNTISATNAAGDILLLGNTTGVVEISSNATKAGTLRFREPVGGGVNFITFQAPVMAGDTAYQWWPAYPTVSGQITTSTNAGVMTWTTATYPATTTINRILYSSAANTITDLATANSASLVTTSAGVPVFSGSLADGQIIIGATGGTPAAASLTAGTGITITPGANSISLSVTGGAAVTSVSGTANRITSTGGTTPVIDISAAYVGQASLVTVGALTTGSLAAGFTPVTVPIGGTGNTTFTAYSVICAGTTATGAFQNVTGVGTANFVLTSNGAGALPTWQAVGSGGTAVTSIAGAANQITASSSTGAVTLSISNNAILPGTGGVTLPTGNTAARAGAAGTIRYNSQTALAELTNDGATWSAINTATSSVDTVSGTANRITSTGGNNPVIDISGSYVGQASLTTVGSLASGSLVAGFTPVTVPLGGTGNTTFTAYSLICAGTTATGTFQNVVGLGASGQVLTSAGAGALPAWQTPTTGTVTSVSGTANRITSSGGATPVIDISAAYVGQTSIVTVGALTTGSLAAGFTPVPLAIGGTNAALTASNGGIFYSTATAGAILAGTATAQQLLMSGASTAPIWSTTTYPTTNAINTLLYASSANIMSALATANSGVLVTSAGGVPSISTTIPATTQANITATGALAAGSLAAGFTPVTVPLGGTGVATLTTAYGVLTAGTTATGPVQTLAALGAAGTVLTSNGAGALPSFQAPSVAGTGGLKSFQILTSGSAATYTRPAGITSILVECLGGGGGGGGMNSTTITSSSAGGGGGGGYSRKYIASAAATYTYTVGASGAGGTAGTNNGSTGGTSSFSTISATGGTGGVGGAGSGTVAAIGGAGSNGGAGSSGDFNEGGQPGYTGLNLASGGLSGFGGASTLGAGAIQIFTAGSSSAGGAALANSGGGGSGASGNGVNANQAGGAGGSGLIVVWEFS